MSEIKPTFNANPTPIISSKSSTQQAQQQAVFLPETTTDLGLHISAEAQYLFEMDQYLSTLDKQGQDKALVFLSQSEDPLQRKAVDYFQKNQATLSQIFNGKDTLVLDHGDSQNQAKLLGNAAMPDTPVVAIVLANLFPTFRFDGKENRNPVEGYGYNQTLNDQLETLKPTLNELLDEQDATTLTRIMANMLQNAEKALVSLDDVIHFNYQTETTKKAIAFYDVPQELKSLLTEMVDKAVIYQDEKQSRFLKDSIRFFNHAEAGAIVKENFRMGTAAQAYNNKLNDLLKATNLSVLNAQGAITKLLIQHDELIKFGPHKIGEALAFYQQDYENFNRILNKEFNPPVTKKAEIDKTILDIGSNYALKVIEQIQQYTGNN